MTSQDMLFRLIKSLSSSERREFSKGKGKDKYMALYNALLRMPDYDEVELRRKYKHAQPDFLGRLAANKNYLIDKILESLVGQARLRTAESKIQFLLAYLPMLYEKRQYKLLYKRLAVGIKNARDLEAFGLLIDLLEWEKKLVWNDHSNKYERSVEQILQDQEQTLDKFQELFAIRNLRRRLDLLNREDALLLKQSSRDKFQEFCADELLQLPSPLQSSEATRHQHYLKLDVIRKKGTKDELFSQAKSLVVSFEKNGQTDHPSYGMTLSTFLFVSREVNEYGDYLETLQKWEDFLSKGADPHIGKKEVFARIGYWKLIYCLNTDDYEMAASLVAEVEERWNEIAGKLATGKLVTFYYNLMMYYWIVDELKKCQYWLEQLTLFRKIDRRADVVRGARLFQLIFYYEYQQQQLSPERDLQKIIDSTRKVLGSDDYTKAVVKHSSALCKAKNKSETMAIIKSLNDTLSSFDASKAKYFCLDEIKLWCLSKIKGRSMLQLRTEE